jgi:hypothetical protein
MLTKTEADLAADTLLAQARTQSEAIRRRPEMPQWFADAPDGLDPEQKRRRFAELQKQARGVTGFVALEFGAVLGTALPIFARHLKPSWMICMVTLYALLVLAAFLARKHLLARLLRQHVRKNASL